MKSKNLNHFYDLSPDVLFKAVENALLKPTGEFLQLNSFENRVFKVFLEEPLHNERALVVKFYRPNRWTKEAILEEHSFLLELKDQGIPAVAPLKLPSGSTIAAQDGLIHCLYPMAKGRIPQEFNLSDLAAIGRLLAQVHNLGGQRMAHHRPSMADEDVFLDNRDLLQNWIAPEVKSRYLSAADRIFDFLATEMNPREFLRIHGDCHRGNLLQTDPIDSEKQLFLLDFDDFGMGPEVQDFWMLLSSAQKSENQTELDALMTGYESLRAFPFHQIPWIPALRGLRIFSYAAWIARRWQDPSFPQLFPQFETYNYWAEEVEQLERMAWSLEAEDPFAS